MHYWLFQPQIKLSSQICKSKPSSFSFFLFKIRLLLLFGKDGREKLQPYIAKLKVLRPKREERKYEKKDDE